MKDWSEWEIIRRQVAIGGQVVNEHGEPVAGVPVTITSMPKSFKARVTVAAEAAGAAWQSDVERLDYTVARSDGIFFFLDLPEGRYTVTAADGGSGRKAEKSVAVSIEDEESIKVTHADLKLAG